MDVVELLGYTFFRNALWGSLLASIACGIIGIVNFTHEHISVPEGVVVRDVDVVSSIQEIVFETSDRYNKD